jgi:hypothetical protein
MPEVVEVVVFSLGGAENVHNDIAVIQQQPAGIDSPFMVVRNDALLLQTQLDFIIDSAQLPFIIAGTDYKVVGEAAHFTGIQKDDIGCLFFTRDVNGSAGYFDCFQYPYLQSDIIVY